MVIGGGSNVLFRDDYPGFLLRMMIPGFEKIKEDEEHYFVRAGAGEIWHSFVRKMLDAGMPGLENLAYIPGTVGAAPIQNIGAYGLEAAEFIESVECFDMNSGELLTLTNEECDFGYRHSTFKKPENRHLVITAVTFKLSKNWVPNTSYKALAEEIEINSFPELSPQDVYSCVISLRRRKLPSPVKFGNAGSFFMNPVVAREVFEALREQYPQMPFYEMSADRIKIPAGWMIDQCGWKGKSLGPAAVHDKQALVLVNRGGATGADIVALSDAVRASVRDKFGIDIHPEVNFI